MFRSSNWLKPLQFFLWTVHPLGLFSRHQISCMWLEMLWSDNRPCDTKAYTCIAQEFEQHVSENIYADQDNFIFKLICCNAKLWNIDQTYLKINMQLIAHKKYCQQHSMPCLWLHVRSRITNLLLGLCSNLNSNNFEEGLSNQVQQ